MKRGVDYIGVAVGAVIRNNEGKYFMSKRGAQVTNEKGKWEFPGGAIEFGETLEQAINREVMEEYGVKINTVKLLGVVDHILPDEKQHWVSPSFLCELVEGEPKIMEPDKCDEIGWFAIEEIEAKELTMPTKHDLDKLKEYLSNV